MLFYSDNLEIVCRQGNLFIFRISVMRFMPNISYKNPQYLNSCDGICYEGSLFVILDYFLIKIYYYYDFPIQFCTFYYIFRLFSITCHNFLITFELLQSFSTLLIYLS